MRLPAPALHGTFAKAYSLLTRLAAKIGWDDLLKCRSSVFVMEEEYRILKAKEEERKNSVSQSSKPLNEEKSAANESEKQQGEGEQQTAEDQVSEKLENVDLNDDNKNDESQAPKMDEPSLERPQQAAEENKVCRYIWRFCTFIHEIYFAGFFNH